MLDLRIMLTPRTVVIVEKNVWRSAKLLCLERGLQCAGPPETTIHHHEIRKTSPLAIQFFKWHRDVAAPCSNPFRRRFTGHWHAPCASEANRRIDQGNLVTTGKSLADSRSKKAVTLYGNSGELKPPSKPRRSARTEFEVAVRRCQPIPKPASGLFIQPRFIGDFKALDSLDIQEAGEIDVTP